MLTPRQQIIQYIEQGHIAIAQLKQALSISKVTPSKNDWASFVDQILLWLGGMALAFAAMFFIAYNWNDIGRFAKFGLIQALILLAIAAYWKLGSHKVIGKVSLLVACIFLGVLLALYGQTYQTGADPWQLFFNWALLMLPWAFIARFAAIWVFWLLLINLSIALYHEVFRGIFGFMFSYDNELLWLIFIFNTLALITWEVLTRVFPWLAERWAIRLIAVASGMSLTSLVLNDIFGADHINSLSALVWVAALAALYYVYRHLKRDLFMLAGACLSGIVVLVAFLSRNMLQSGDPGGFLILALIVIGLGTGSAIWLRNIHREWLS